MKRTIQPQQEQELLRKKEIHHNRAVLITGLLESRKSLLVGSSGFSIRITPSSAYYSMFKDLLSQIAQDHISYKLAIDALLQGEDIPSELLVDL